MWLSIKIETFEVLGRERYFLDWFLAYHGKGVRFTLPSEVAIVTPPKLSTMG